MQEEKKPAKLPHNIILEDRNRMSVSGVNDIDRFDESTVVLRTELGELTVKGKNLHISKLNVDTGDVNMDGEITALFYSQDVGQKEPGGLLSRMFR